MDCLPKQGRCGGGGGGGGLGGDGVACSRILIFVKASVLY